MNGLHIFTLKDVPVRVSMWFLLLIGYYVWGSGLQRGLVFGVSVFISILIHEFGHALVARHFALSPSVELHGFGGLTHHQRAASNRDDVLIIAAGPGAGLVFGAIVYGVYLVVKSAAPGVLYHQPYTRMIFDDLLFINIGWSLVNLLPLWPLDGGQLFRILMLRVFPPGTAERTTHIVGLVVGIGGAIVAMNYFGRGLVFIIAILLAFQNAMRLGDTRASGPIRASNRFARGLLKKAEAAFEARDWVAARQLSHQIRAETNLDPRTLDRVWTILSVATVELGDYDEAWSYVQRAKLEGPVVFAKAKVVVALDMPGEARELLQHPGAQKLPTSLREGLEEVAAAQPSS